MITEEDIIPFVPTKKQTNKKHYRSGVKLSQLVHDAERSIVAQALEAHNNVVAETARSLGVERSNFHKKLKALGLRS